MFLQLWHDFEAWVDSILPGLKTYLITALGAIGSLAGILQQYVSGLPLGDFVTPQQLSIITAVLFTLAFWLHDIGSRVQDRQ